MLTTFAIVAGSFGLLLAVVWVARKWLRRGDRRSPFTKDMLRGPGHSLRERLDELSWEVATYLAMAPTVPLALYAIYLQQRLVAATISGTTKGIYAFASIAVVIFVGWRIIRIMRDLRNSRMCGRRHSNMQVAMRRPAIDGSCRTGCTRSTMVLGWSGTCPCIRCHVTRFATKQSKRRSAPIAWSLASLVRMSCLHICAIGLISRRSGNWKSL